VNADERYWIPLNGSSCALSALPLQNPMLTPTREWLLGFPTLEEAQRAQSICLRASIEAVRRFMEGLRPDVKSGRIRGVSEGLCKRFL
jgi:hypothetical protein